MSRPQPPHNGETHLRISVWSRSYDDPHLVARNSLISEIKFLQPETDASNASVFDRAGADVTSYFMRGASSLEGYREGFDGAQVRWTSIAGVYDERCATDLTVDSQRRLNEIIPGPPFPSVRFYSYLVSPIRIELSVDVLPAQLGFAFVRRYIGGRQGDAVTTETCEVWA
jgi:hypothetical protein